MPRQPASRKLHPGPSSNESAPNHANYDESLANPFPRLSPLLVGRDGEIVTTKEAWLGKRRPEIVELFEREAVGRVSHAVPAVTGRVVDESEGTRSETVFVETTLEGIADNAQCPEIEVKIQLKVGRPTSSEAPVPVLVMFTFSGWNRPVAHRLPPRHAESASQEDLAQKAWGYALVVPNSIQPDNGAGLTRGIIGLASRGQPRKPVGGGALLGWAWGAPRVLDYLQTHPSLDAKRVGVEGVSRYGKAARVTCSYLGSPRLAGSERRHMGWGRILG